jgi:Protein of unknown function (DUF551)
MRELTHQEIEDLGEMGSISVMGENRDGSPYHMCVEPSQIAYAIDCAVARATVWQDIATAPRDGAKIIGAFFSIRWADSHRKHDIVKCWWQKEFDAFISSARVMTMAKGLLIDGVSEKMHSPVIEPITHWMPLPKPPVGNANG